MITPNLIWNRPNDASNQKSYRNLASIALLEIISATKKSEKIQSYLEKTSNTQKDLQREIEKQKIILMSGASKNTLTTAEKRKNIANIYGESIRMWEVMNENIQVTENTLEKIFSKNSEEYAEIGTAMRAFSEDISAFTENQLKDLNDLLTMEFEVIDHHTESHEHMKAISECVEGILSGRYTEFILAA